MASPGLSSPAGRIQEEEATAVRGRWLETPLRAMSVYAPLSSPRGKRLK
jgi:hypothetical protein